MKKVFLVMCFLIFTGVIVFSITGPMHNAKKNLRLLEVIETVALDIPENSKRLRLWVPKPPSNAHQSVKLLEVNSPWPFRITSDSEFGNKTLFMSVANPDSGQVEITLKYRILRKAEHGSDNSSLPTANDLYPRGLLAINDEIRQIAEEKTKGTADTLEKARAIYNYVLNHMAYDKSGTGWGRGDSIYACRIGKGNCTDFHSLFMAIAMTNDIPVRFYMGYSVPQTSEGNLDSAYHCWAEFFVSGKGWYPVDISEAWKNRKLVNFYFGNLDENRVLVSAGRNITLTPPQNAPPLNFLNTPYCEINGSPINNVKYARKYRNLS